ncbi:hypothetical protein [Burkholderia sp. Se-20378]|nr:hypothetical protein [Burkholderia sp. Se-20378]MBN3768679.1 hypothetical protein [Burkholderia sp. Se-20378]
MPRAPLNNEAKAADDGRVDVVTESGEIDGRRLALDACEIADAGIGA